MGVKKGETQEFADRLRIEGVCCKGYGLIPKAVMRDPDLSITAKAIYAYFAAMSGSGDSTFPSMKTILEHIHLNKDTYLKHRDQLTSQGYIQVLKERSGGEFTVNTYTLISSPKKYEELTPQNDWQSELISTIEQEGLKAAGYGIIPKAVMQDPRMDTSAKALYAYFASYAGAGQVAFPPVPQICIDLGISAGTYQKRMKILQDLDYIEVRQNNWTGTGPKRGFGSNRYIMKDRPRPLSHHKISETVKSETVSSEMGLSETVISDTKKSETSNNNTSIKNTISNNTFSSNKSYQSSRQNKKAKQQDSEKIDRIENRLITEEDYINFFHNRDDYRLITQYAPESTVRQIDEAILLIASICKQPSDAKIKVGGEERTSGEIRKRFLNLTIDHIVYAINSFNKRCKMDIAPIQNVRAYMLTTLYRTPETLESSYFAY